MASSDRGWRTSTSTFLILAVFAALNAVIGAFTVEGAALKFGGDASSWYEPTMGLLRHGAFVNPDNPSQLLTFRPPLYPLFAAALLWLSGGAIWTVIAGQIVLLFATGWIARAMTVRWLPGYGNWMLALVVFNPNALGTAHLFQSDTLYAFTITATVASLLYFAQRPVWTTAISAGALFGLSLLCRTTGQFLLYAWPVGLMVLGTLAAGWRDWRRSLLMGLASAAVAGAVTVPWLLHNHRAGEGMALTTNYLRSYFLWDNISYLEKYAKSIGQTEAERSAIAIRDGFGELYGPDFAKLPEREKFAYLEARGREQFLTYPPRAYALAFGWAWTQYFGIPGVSNFLNLFGFGEQTAFAAYRAKPYDNYVQAGLDALRNSSPAFVVLTAAGFAFVLVIRSLGLIGIAALLRRRVWPVLLIVAAGVGYFTLIHLFVANSRYRLPIEPLLFLLALYGLDACRHRPVISQSPTAPKA